MRRLLLKEKKKTCDVLVFFLRPLPRVLFDLFVLLKLFNSSALSILDGGNFGGFRSILKEGPNLLKSTFLLTVLKTFRLSPV